MKNPFNLHWIYDTSLTIPTCLDLLSRLSPNNSYVSSRVYCSSISETQIELSFRQPENFSKIYCSRYVAEFYMVDTGQTVIVLRFVNEILGFLPCIPIDEVDVLFNGLIQARRRK